MEVILERGAHAEATLAAVSGRCELLRLESCGPRRCIAVGYRTRGSIPTLTDGNVSCHWSQALLMCADHSSCLPRALTPFFRKNVSIKAVSRQIESTHLNHFK